MGQTVPIQTIPLGDCIVSVWKFEFKKLAETKELCRVCIASLYRWWYGDEQSDGVRQVFYLEEGNRVVN